MSAELIAILAVGVTIGGRPANINYLRGENRNDQPIWEFGANVFIEFFGTNQLNPTRLLPHRRIWRRWAKLEREISNQSAAIVPFYRKEWV